MEFSLEAKPKKTRKARVVKTDEELIAEMGKVKQRDLGKLVGVYCKRVRAHDRTQLLGIFKNLRRLVDKDGVTLHELQTALENYIADIQATSLDVRLRKNIRSFFTVENIKAWQQPLARRNAKPQGPRDPALDAFDRFDQFMETRNG